VYNYTALYDRDARGMHTFLTATSLHYVRSNTERNMNETERIVFNVPNVLVSCRPTKSLTEIAIN